MDSGKNAEINFSVSDIKSETAAADIFAENKAYLEKLEREKKSGAIDDKFAFPFDVKEPPRQAEIKIDRELKYIGQVLNTFLIFDDGQDIYFIDQHAAHE